MRASNETFDINFSPSIPLVIDQIIVTSIIVIILLLFSFFSQTVALKLKNTDLTNYTSCLGLLQQVANAYEVKLFHRKTVHEFLWGYTDPLLNTIVNLKSPACPSTAAEGASSYVQLQVCDSYHVFSVLDQ